RSWPPAWVKLKSDNQGNAGADGSGNTALVLARGMFSSLQHSNPSETDPQVKALDTRLLIGSVSQKALWLQEELRHNRTRLIELQRHPGRELPAL
ncbi:unnamed protein product, partial [Laminaria digitata]